MATQLALTKEQIQGKPPITVPDFNNRVYKLVWYNHFKPGQLFEVKNTNLATPSDDMSNALFESWCTIFDPAESEITGVKLIAADEHFKTDYTHWTEAPFNLPQLAVRWFEIMDDERWYVVELKKH